MLGRSSTISILKHPAVTLQIVIPLTATRSPSSHSATVALLLSCHLLEMSANLQTLRFCSAMLSRGGVFPLRHFPMSQALFCHHHLVPGAISSPFAKARLDTRWPRATGGTDQVDGSRHFNAKDFSSPELFLWAMPFFDFARNNFLPLGLVSGVLLGLASPSLGLLAERYSVSKFSTIGIFLISGLTLRSEEIGAAVEAWPAGILGVTSILLLTPIFARIILQVHLNPHEFVTGLAIFCCMPTTLSSGVALTQLVGGNSALALAMTIISNLIGIMTVPFTLAKFVGGAGVSVPTMQLFKSLVMTLLVPLTLGKVLRDSIKSVAIYVDQNRRSLSMISAILLSLVPGTQVSRSKSLLLAVRPEIFATAVCMGALVHLVLLALNTLAVQILSMFCGGKESVLAKRENARAVIIVASQKTLPVMVAIVEQLKGALGNPGLLVLPCVAAHINQIIIDSFLVDWWIKSQPSPTTERV